MKTVLITGGSSGIGYSLAELFAKDKYRIIIVARDTQTLKKSADELKKEYDVDVVTISKDLSLQKSAQEIHSELTRKKIEVDILINNAGFGTFGFFEKQILSSQEAMIALNITSLTQLTHLFLQDMIKRKSGKIMNVASTAAFQPGPLMSVYFATKAYVLHFTEALANETRKTGVSMYAFCPGPTLTNFQKRAQMRIEDIEKRSSFFMTAKRAADIAYKGLEKNKTLIIPGWKNKILSIIVQFLPRSFVVRAMRRYQDGK